MRFVCLGYTDERIWDAMSKDQQAALVQQCLAFNDELRKNGHTVIDGEALQSVRTAKTLRHRDGKLLVTDGPYAESKEQLGGFGMIEARDIDHAVELLLRHPIARVGPVELRAVDGELTERCSLESPTPGAATEGKKFVCLAYGDEKNWNALSPSERDAMIAECIAHGEAMRQHGSWVGGQALHSAATARTLRPKGDKVLVTDGPYAETKEQLGGVATFRFRDMDQAIEAWSRHPCLRTGDSLEIRPAEDMCMEAMRNQVEAHAKP